MKSDKNKISVLMISLDLQILQPEYSTAQERHLEYAQAFEELHVIVLSSKRDHLPEKIKPEFHQANLHVWATHSLWKPLAVIQAILIARRINQLQKIQVVSAQDPLATGLTAWLISLVLNIPWNLQFHSSFFLTEFHQPQNLLQSLVQRWVLWLTKQAQTIRTVSQEVRQTLINRLNLDAASVVWIPMMTEIRYFQRSVKPITKPRRLINVGRLVPAKNQLALIQALQVVMKTYPDIHLTIVGDGALRHRIEAAIKALNLERSITLTGSLSKKQVRAELHRADAFVSVSLFEGFGVAMIEALAAGLPLVSTNVGVVKDLLIDQKHVSVISSSNPDDISHRLFQVLKEPKKLYTQAREGQKLVQTTFDQQKLVKDWIELLYQTSEYQK